MDWGDNRSRSRQREENMTMSVAFEEPITAVDKPLHIKELEVHAIEGYTALMATFGLAIVGLVAIIIGANAESGGMIALGVTSGLLLGLTAFLCLLGLFTVAPNQAKVLQLFGSYKGT